VIITDKRFERDRLLYNLLPGDRARIREYQGDLDPITGQPLVVNANLDHDHKTGLVRGLLNPLTNKFLIDNIAILRASIAYLERPPAPLALGEHVFGLIGKAQIKKIMKYGPFGSLERAPRSVEERAALHFPEV
jgi:Recombination endonuclease VII